MKVLISAVLFLSTLLAPSVTRSEDLLGTPGIWPDLVSSSVKEEIFITVTLSSSNVVPRSVLAQYVDSTGEVIKTLGKLNDEGKNGDEDANDQIYSGHVFVTGSPDEKILIRASAAFRGNAPRTHSPTVPLYFVDLSLPTVPPSDSEYPPVANTTTEEQMDCDRVNAEFDLSIGSEAIAGIVENVGGSIEGAIPGLAGWWQIGFGCLDVEGINLKARELTRKSGVISAEPNYYSEPDGVVSCNGFECSSMQWGRDEIGVDKVLNRYWPLQAVGVGVIDTGVIDDHPDLSVSKHYTDPWWWIPEGDREGHGTGVAGIIGATAYNGFGIDGACPNCKIISGKLRIWSSSHIATVINKVAKSGRVKVLNLSYGSKCKSPSSIQQAAVRKAIRTYGITVVTSAGNDGWNGKKYDIPEVIHVGAFDYDGQMSRWYPQAQTCSEFGAISNFGDNWVSVYAPGRDIFTTEWGGQYTNGFEGTSAAAPFVASVVGMMLGGRSQLTPAQISTMIRQSSVPLYRVINGKKYHSKDMSGDRIYRVDALSAYRAPIPKFIIDGDGKDWEGVPWVYEHLDYIGGPIIRWKVETDNEHIYFLRTMPSGQMNGGVLHIDADNDSTTGGCDVGGTEAGLFILLPHDLTYFPNGIVNGDVKFNRSQQFSTGCGGVEESTYPVVWSVSDDYLEISLPKRYVRNLADGSRYMRIWGGWYPSDPIKFR